MKKVLIVVIPLALIAVLLVAFNSFAQGRMMMHRGGGMGKDFLFWRLDQLSKDLKLDTAQQAKMDAFKQDLSAQMDQRMQKARDVHDAIRQELAKPNPDTAKIVSLIDQQIDQRAQAAHEMVRKVENFYNDLTPEQRKLFVDHLQQHMNNAARWHD